MTLRVARNDFVEFGACDAKMLKNVLPVEKRTAFRYQRREA